MSDLISREAAWEEIKKVPLINPDRMAFKLQQALWDVPAVDAAPVVHGEWKYFRKQNRAVCTNCSFERDLDINFGKAVACPNCGAKMGGGIK